MKKADTMAKVYDPAGVEKRIYQNWEEQGYFKGHADPEKKPFTIVIPPPNITGQLHNAAKPCILLNLINIS